MGIGGIFRVRGFNASSRKAHTVMTMDYSTVLTEELGRNPPDIEQPLTWRLKAPRHMDALVSRVFG